MKIIRITRGASSVNYTASNGDVYDSTLEVIDRDGERVYQTDYCNADATKDYRGGRLAKGVYYGICGLHKGRYKAIKLFAVKTLSDGERLAQINSEDALNISERTLPSEIPNPNHGGKSIIRYVNIHKGGENWDWSHGCITIMGANYERFIRHFEMNEKVRVELI